MNVRWFIIGVLILGSGISLARGAENDATATADPIPTEEMASEEKLDFRDPFRPFNLKLRPNNPEPPKTPLEQYDIGSLTLVAVIWNVSNPKAMVEDDAGLGYTIGIGTPIGRNAGLVKVIEPDRVIIEEQGTNFFNEVVTSEKILELKSEEGENQR